MSGKFKKGQKVYFASTNVSTVYNNDRTTKMTLCMVIERTVDSCGNKKMTFEDDGNDFVFGKSCWFEYCKNYFSTPEEAFSFLKSETEKKCTGKLVIHETVMSDKSKEWYVVSTKWNEDNKEI